MLAIQEHGSAFLFLLNDHQHKLLGKREHPVLRMLYAFPVPPKKAAGTILPRTRVRQSKKDPSERG
jgi:hypothetical protein